MSTDLKPFHDYHPSSEAQRKVALEFVEGIVAAAENPDISMSVEVLHKIMYKALRDNIPAEYEVTRQDTDAMLVIAGKAVFG